MFPAARGFGAGLVRMPNVQQIAEAAAKREKEMNALVERNGCKGPGLMRFQENLQLFTMNRPFGIRPNGSTEPLVPIPAPGTKFEDQNYQWLLEKMIIDNSRGWKINKYGRDSLTKPQVVTRDAQGRPLEIAADYIYNSMAGPAIGSVKLIFYEGYPQCLYFHDRAQTCVTPDKVLVSQYVHGYLSIENTPI